MAASGHRRGPTPATRALSVANFAIEKPF